jgi:hypothetical protein
MSVAAPRQRLQNRRAHCLSRFEARGQMYTGGIGRFDDGRIDDTNVNTLALRYRFDRSSEQSIRAEVVELRSTLGSPT